ncbi:MAG TPA: LysR family transcriptional regulator [Roseobacter sp.]|nr:LysR family transcriptional regulator [Roseobacter sp.]HEC71886.1 LysR family transcriptional regulator [Roseobacter sp.]
MNTDLEIDLLRTFVAVAAHQNFTYAARTIGRTQSAVGIQMSIASRTCPSDTPKQIDRRIWRKISSF